MTHPTPRDDVSSSLRIPLHSALAKPMACAITGMCAFGVSGLVVAALKGDEALHPGVLLPISLSLGLMVWKMWDLCQRVYLTSDGIELNRPPRVVPWSQVGAAFRVPLMGSWPSTCCIGINEPDNWDLHFFGRQDFESVVAQFRPAKDQGARQVARRSSGSVSRR
jgi:hypothetical protein